MRSVLLSADIIQLMDHYFNRQNTQERITFLFVYIKETDTELHDSQKNPNHLLLLSGMLHCLRAAAKHRCCKDRGEGVEG